MSENTTAEGEKEEVCAFCKSFANKKCSYCKRVYYCSREHQKLDWGNHWKNCKTVMLVENSTIGRHYIARRNIKMDEIILKDNEPLLVAPQQDTVPVCLNCYVPLTLEKSKPCENCGWPLCLDCTIHGPECQLTMKYRESKIEIDGYSMPSMIYDSIFVLRALALREKSPDDYEKFLNLSYYYNEIMNEAFGILLSNAHILKRRLQINDLNEEEIARMLGIFRINGFKTTCPKGNRYAAVFYEASYFTHECHPNCGWISLNDANSGAKIVVRAIRKIPKGQSMTITYTTPLDGTKNRREILRDSKFFNCTCERCKDPTEFGTMFSAVKCLQKDCTGYMLPSTFLVPKNTPIPDFVCNKCELTTPSTTIDEIMKEPSTQLSEMNPKTENWLKRFVENQSKILHHNHFHIVNAQIEIAIEFTRNLVDPNSLSDKYLKETINLCKKLVGLLEILAPADYDKRGRILLSECVYMLPLIQRQLSGNRDDCLILYKDCKKIFNEAYRLLCFATDQDTIHRLEEIRHLLETRLRQHFEIS